MLARVSKAISWRTTLLRAQLAGGERRAWAQAHTRGSRLAPRLASLVRRREMVVYSLVEHLGDLVAAEPVLRTVRQRHPKAYLVHIVSRRCLPLVQHHPAVDEWIPVDSLGEWFVAQDDVRRILPAGHLYDLHLPGRWCDLTKRTRTTPLPPSAEGLDTTSYYKRGSLLHAFAALADVTPTDRQPQLHLAGDVAEQVDALKLPSRFVVVHATSNEASRDWRADGWNELAATLGDVMFVEIGLRPILAPASNVLSLCGQINLPQTCEVIRRGALFVGIDSGPAHFANAMGTPGVILLGQYAGFHHYCPYSGFYAGEGATLLHADGPAASLSVDEVSAAVQARLKTAVAA